MRENPETEILSQTENIIYIYKKYREIACHEKHFHHLNGMPFTGEAQVFPLLHRDKAFPGYYKNHDDKTEQNVSVSQRTSRAIACCGGGMG